VEDVVIEIQEKVPLDAVEESVHSMSTGLGQQVLHGVIQVLGDRFAIAGGDFISETSAEKVLICAGKDQSLLFSKFFS
jgi:hypothetical protein